MANTQNYFSCMLHSAFSSFPDHRLSAVRKRYNKVICILQILLLKTKWFLKRMGTCCPAHIQIPWEVMLAQADISGRNS